MKIRSTDTTSGQPGYCPACRVEMKRGPDACLGYLPGVTHACCGHGDEERAYVVVAPGYDPNACCAFIPEQDMLTAYGHDAAVLLSYLTAPA